MPDPLEPSFLKAIHERLLQGDRLASEKLTTQLFGAEGRKVSIERARAIASLSRAGLAARSEMMGFRTVLLSLVRESLERFSS